MLRLALISLSVLCIACLPHQPSPAGRDFAALVDDYFDALFRWNPTSATAWGNHDHDTVDGLMKRNFAPGPEWLRSVVAPAPRRPALMAAMRENISNPPREFTDLAFSARGATA
ncbi:MAG: hypothetical protein ACREF4_04350 [Gammaproteobacteria bacterium]